MGTHNSLLNLGEESYLEIIAVNPDAARPGRPRWFGLDRLEPPAAPRLAAWVARTNDIQVAAAASPEPLGEIEPMSRGPWNWQITIPVDGSLPARGIAPMLIQWADGPHPASVLRDQGCSLLRLEGYHSDPERITSTLKSVGFEGNFAVHALPPQGQPHLVAHIWTPTGVVRLGSTSQSRPVASR